MFSPLSKQFQDNFFFSTINKFYIGTRLENIFLKKCSETKLHSSLELYNTTLLISNILKNVQLKYLNHFVKQ